MTEQEIETMLRDSGQELQIEKLQILKHLTIDGISVVKG